jgi:hypothetical protein
MQISTKMIKNPLQNSQPRLSTDFTYLLNMKYNGIINTNFDTPIDDIDNFKNNLKLSNSLMEYFILDIVNDAKTLMNNDKNNILIITYNFLKWFENEKDETVEYIFKVINFIHIRFRIRIY